MNINIVNVITNIIDVSGKIDISKLHDVFNNLFYPDLNIEIVDDIMENHEFRDNLYDINDFDKKEILNMIKFNNKFVDIMLVYHIDLIDISINEVNNKIKEIYENYDDFINELVKLFDKNGYSIDDYYEIVYDNPVKVYFLENVFDFIQEILIDQKFDEE